MGHDLVAAFPYDCLIDHVREGNNIEYREIEFLLYDGGKRGKIGSLHDHASMSGFFRARFIAGKSNSTSTISRSSCRLFLFSVHVVKTPQPRFSRFNCIISIFPKVNLYFESALKSNRLAFGRNRTANSLG